MEVWPAARVADAVPATATARKIAARPNARILAGISGTKTSDPDFPLWSRPDMRRILVAFTAATLLARPVLAHPGSAIV